MELGLYLLANGLAMGAIYALVAFGFGFIYNTVRIFHIAHAGVLSFAAYVVFTLRITLGLPAPVAISGAILAASGLGMLLELLVYRPLVKRSARIGAIILTSVGIMIVLNNGLAVIFTRDVHVLRKTMFVPVQLGPVAMSSLRLATIIISILVFLVLYFFFTRTKTGKALRALADNPVLAKVVGIDVDNLRLFIFAMGSGLGALAVTLYAYDVGVHFQYGLELVAAAIVAIIIGGRGSVAGIILGAVLAGLITNLGVWFLSTLWKEAIFFGTVMLFLVFRPRGLLGKGLLTRRA